MQILLCGAHDVGNVHDGFKEVIQNFGATPLFYKDGSIWYENSGTSSWVKNSRASVDRVDICVFVILEKYGDITWNHEFEEVLEQGKPFVVLALDSSWAKYDAILHSVSDPDSIGESEKSMVYTLNKITAEYQLTVVTFSYNSFNERLRTSISYLMTYGIELLQRRNQRMALLESLKATSVLTPGQIVKLVSLASDEYEENKLARKIAIERLGAAQVRDNKFVLDICGSAEQGVQRLAFEQLADLVTVPLDDGLLGDLARIAGNRADVGVARRLISSVTRLDPTKLDVLLEAMGSSEEGVRRLAFEAVESNWTEVVQAWGKERMASYLRACEAKSSTRVSWQRRLQDKLDDLT